MSKAAPQTDPAEEREAYYAEARSWGIDREADARKSRRTASPPRY